MTGDLLTEHVLKCLIYGDKGRDETIQVICDVIAGAWGKKF